LKQHIVEFSVRQQMRKAVVASDHGGHRAGGRARQRSKIIDVRGCLHGSTGEFGPQSFDGPGEMSDAVTL